MQRVRPRVVATPKRHLHRRIARLAGAGLIALSLTFAAAPGLSAAKTTTGSGPNVPYTWGHAVANLDKTVVDGHRRW